MELTDLQREMIRRAATTGSLHRKDTTDAVIGEAIFDGLGESVIGDGNVYTNRELSQQSLRELAGLVNADYLRVTGEYGDETVYALTDDGRDRAMVLGFIPGN